MNKDFYDKPLYTITNYFIGFLLSGLYLAICNILLILFFFFTFIYPDKFNIFILFIALVPLGPSLGALYSTMSKIIRENDMFFSSYFWNSYKKNFVSNLKLWLIELIPITILFIDFQYFYLNMPEKGIHIIFAVLIIILLVIGLYAFSINSRFEIKLKDLLLLSLYYMIKKFPITILKIAVIAFGYYILKIISIFFIIFMPSIICIVFYYYDRMIFSELEIRFLSSNKNGVK